MASWSDRLRQAEREDLEILDSPDRLAFERLLQWLRLSFLATPPLVLVAFGMSALPYALGIVAVVALSFTWIAVLTRRAPQRVLRWQLWLRVVDCGLVYLVLVNYHGFLHNAYYDSVYLLFVVAAAATHGRRGAAILSATAGVAVLLSRIQLIASGAVAFEIRHLTDAVFYALLFAITSTAIAFLMRTSADVVRRREHAWRTELAERNVDLERAAAELAKSVQLRDAMLTGVTHDLRTPLTVIKVQAQLARRRQNGRTDPEAQTMRSGLEQIERAATRMAHWIDELLQVSRVQATEEMILDVNSADLVQLTRQAIAEHQNNTRRHVLALHTDPEHVVGLWDSARLERVLDNLIGNAIKYSPQGGPIDVRVARQDGFAVLQVHDEGVGIPAADLPAIFEPFTRGSNVEGRITGTGLGLTGTRKIVEHHGGTLEVESREGQGSTFTVRLPLEPRVE